MLEERAQLVKRPRICLFGEELDGEWGYWLCGPKTGESSVVASAQAVQVGRVFIYEVKNFLRASASSIVFYWLVRSLVRWIRIMW